MNPAKPVKGNKPMRTLVLIGQPGVAKCGVVAKCAAFSSESIVKQKYIFPEIIRSSNEKNVLISNSVTIISIKFVYYDNIKVVSFF